MKQKNKRILFVVMMMKKTNSIRLLTVAAVIGVVILGRRFLPDVSSPNSSDSSEIQSETEQTKDSSIEEDKIKMETTETSDTNNSFEFMIVAEDGYLTVYESDLKTVYEYTDISVEELEEDLKVKVNQGYGMENIEALFNFLENYSS